MVYIGVYSISYSDRLCLSDKSSMEKEKEIMGYRLEMSKVEYAACGGKLYGYVDDEKELKSHKWLLDNGYIDGDEYWDYGCNPQIVLRPEEFKEFLKLYQKDFNNYHKCNNPYTKEMQELIDSGKEVLLEWW